VAHPATAPDLWQTFTNLWLAIGLLTGILLYLFIPLMLLIVTLNIRGIRKELRDIAEQLALPSRRL
jgi:ABC-type uncharacterized transport system permease subunit